MEIGGDAPISVQSMTRTRTSDIDATVAQIIQLKEAGCDIVRVAVPDAASARALSSIKDQIRIPLVADIHFDYRLAILAIESGADKIRINPGNLGDRNKIKSVVTKAKDKNIPIRIGVNAGSLERELLQKYGHPCAEALTASALRQLRICEQFQFDNLIVSLKSSDVNMMIDAYRLIAPKIDYPLHLGVTEAGAATPGIIKSAIGIGTLLKEGIGDTLRVSLTADPVKEVQAGLDILRALNLRHKGISIISCPGCGRTQGDLLKIVTEVEKGTAPLKKPITIAIMGCVVNGPGEASEAELGVVLGAKKAILFKNGKKIGTIDNNSITDELIKQATEFST